MITVNWEVVRELFNSKDRGHIGRCLRVPGGWVYIRALAGGDEPPVYIPDPTHEWGKEVRDAE